MLNVTDEKMMKKCGEFTHFLCHMCNDSNFIDVLA